MPYKQKDGRFTAARRIRERIGRSLILQNIIWNYAGLIWLNVLSVFSVSLYVRILGAHQWGLVAACVSLQIVFNVLDMGFSQVAPKWFVDIASNSNQATYFQVFKRLYFYLAIGGFLILQSSAHFLATVWFKLPVTDQAILETAIRLIAIQLAFQFMNSLNNAIWSGQQKQRLMNLRICSFMTLRHVVAISLLYFLNSDVRVYCSVFMVVSIVEWAANYRRVAGTFTKQNREDATVLARRILKDVSILIVGVLVGTAVAQMDRVTLSRALPVEQFGAYTLALTLALAALQLQMPVTRSFFPRMVTDIQSFGHVTRRTWLSLYGFTIVSVGIPTGMLAMLAHPLLMIWVGNATIANAGAPALRILCAGVFLNSINGCLYQYLLASSRNHLILKFNIISLIGVGALILSWQRPLSPVFGGAIWITAGTLQLCCGALWYYVHSRKSPSEESQPC